MICKTWSATTLWVTPMEKNKKENPAFIIVERRFTSNPDSVAFVTYSRYQTVLSDEKTWPLLNKSLLDVSRRRSPVYKL